MRKLLTLYARATPGEYNIGELLREYPELLRRLGVDGIDLEGDDAELALQLASAIGRYKKLTISARADGNSSRAQHAALSMAKAACHEKERVVVDTPLLLGDLLADRSKKFIRFELNTTRIDISRLLLLRSRVVLRTFPETVSSLDHRGLHLAWRDGRGGLNIRHQVVDRGDAVLQVDLRASSSRAMKKNDIGPVLLAEVLTSLGFV